MASTELGLKMLLLTGLQWSALVFKKVMLNHIGIDCALPACRDLNVFNHDR